MRPEQSEDLGFYEQAAGASDMRHKARSPRNSREIAFFRADFWGFLSSPSQREGTGGVFRAGAEGSCLAPSAALPEGASSVNPGRAGAWANLC